MDITPVKDQGLVFTSVCLELGPGFFFFFFLSLLWYKELKECS